MNVNELCYPVACISVIVILSYLPVFLNSEKREDNFQDFSYLTHWKTILIKLTPIDRPAQIVEGAFR